MYSVQREGDRFEELFSETDLDKEERRDQANLASRARRPPEPTASTRPYAPFLASMPNPMQRARADATLSRPMRVKGDVGPRWRHIVRLVDAGYLVETTPHGRRLVAQDGSYFEEQDLTKIALDYAKFLIESKRHGVNERQGDMLRARVY